MDTEILKFECDPERGLSKLPCHKRPGHKQPGHTRPGHKRSSHKRPGHKPPGHIRLLTSKLTSEIRPLQRTFSVTLHVIHENRDVNSDVFVGSGSGFL